MALRDCLALRPDRDIVTRLQRCIGVDVWVEIHPSFFHLIHTEMEIVVSEFVRIKKSRIKNSGTYGGGEHVLAVSVTLCVTFVPKPLTCVFEAGFSSHKLFYFFFLSLWYFIYTLYRVWDMNAVFHFAQQRKPRANTCEFIMLRKRLIRIWLGR